MKMMMLGSSEIAKAFGPSNSLFRRRGSAALPGVAGARGSASEALRGALGLMLVVWLHLCSSASAQSVTVPSTDPGFSLTLPQDIPVNYTSGIADSINLTGTSIASISDVTLTLDISGGWDGDFYAYLWHQTSSGTVMDVLFDRIGVTGGNPAGLSAGGMDVTLSDAGLSGNIQSATGAARVPLSGSYQPDLPLSSFNGMSGDGTWALFIADESSPDLGTLESWSLDITGSSAATSVPDGGDAGLMLLTAFGLMLLPFARNARTPGCVPGILGARHSNSR
jgi:subtilisin-like proprotein convertase family protein